MHSQRHDKNAGRAEKMPEKIEYKDKFVYFPLHYQPELTIDVFGDIFADQLLAVEQLRRILPDDIHIYVKENPKQAIFAREPSFYKRLKAIPGTTYIGTAIDSFELIENCSALATLVGTAGFEALQMGKPVICFRHAWYLCLPGIFNWEDGVRWGDETDIRFDWKTLKQGVEQMSLHFRTGVARPKGYTAIDDGFDPVKNGDVVVNQVINHFENDKQYDS